ncbi:MAG: hypothetical protein ACJ8EP_09995 [Sphingomicrobium sp.]
MSHKDENDEIARLERLSEELSQSLQRCRKMLHDYEARLAANSNELEIPKGRGETREA